MHPWYAYVLHFLLESVGSAIGVYAYRYCKHNWHRLAIWVSLTGITTLVTVSLVG